MICFGIYKMCLDVCELYWNSWNSWKVTEFLWMSMIFRNSFQQQKQWFVYKFMEFHKTVRISRNSMSFHYIAGNCWNSHILHKFCRHRVDLCSYVASHLLWRCRYFLQSAANLGVRLRPLATTKVWATVLDMTFKNAPQNIWIRWPFRATWRLTFERNLTGVPNSCQLGTNTLKSNAIIWSPSPANHPPTGGAGRVHLPHPSPTHPGGINLVPVGKDTDTCAGFPPPVVFLLGLSKPQFAPDGLTRAFMGPASGKSVRAPPEYTYIHTRQIKYPIPPTHPMRWLQY